MNLFTVNQVNQVYALRATSTFASGSSSYTDTKGSGNVYGGITPDGNSMYFKYAGPGGVVRSDLIDIDKIMYVKKTPAGEMAVELKQYMLKLPSALVSSSNLASGYAGYDFILRIALDNYVGISPEDSTYWKYAMVHTSAGMSVNDFWKAMAKSILLNMSREAVKFITVHKVTSTSTVDPTPATLNSISGWSSGVTGIVIREVEPEWILGLKRQKVINVTVTPLPIEKDGSMVYWGNDGTNQQSADTTLKATGSGVYIKNSKLTADYEYFYHGERGDQYRMVGWPDYVPTEYMVNPTDANGYDYIQIHYSYIGSNESCQKSEKDITFLVPRAGTDTTATAVGAKAQSIADFIEAAIETKTINTIADAISADSTGDNRNDLEKALDARLGTS